MVSSYSRLPQGQRLLDVGELTKEQFIGLLDLASELKAAKSAGTEQQWLKQKEIVLIFEKTSTRTRCAFEVAAYDQGAHVTYLGPEGSQIGHKESMKDTARVLGRMYDAIEYRGFSQELVEILAKYAGVPVYNGLTDEFHPTQMLADVLTMREHADKPLEQVAYAFLGDARNNMGRSLLETGAMLGMDVRIVAPKELWPDADSSRSTAREAAQTGARITVTEDVAEGVKGADFLHTDVWVSMGEAHEVWAAAHRAPHAVPDQCGRDATKPATRTPSSCTACPRSTTGRRRWAQEIFEKFGIDCMEVTEEVFESPASIVFDQAENRMHTIKAILVATLAS